MFNILDKVQASCKAFPERNAFYFGETYYTYEQFAQTVSAIRAYLETAHKEDTLVGFLTYDDIETYSAVFSILYANKVFIPINPYNPSDRNASIMQQSGLKLLLTSKPLEEVEGLEVPEGVTVVHIGGMTEAPINLTPPNRDPEDHAYILFTSGSTGIPKGVPISLRALNAFTDAFFALGYEVDENDRFLQMFDMTFDLSLMSYIAPLCIGACVYPIPPGEIKYTYAYELFEEQEITVALMVPSILTHLRPYFEEIDLPKVRYSLFCGEAFYNDIANEWSTCVPNALVQNVYGPTEATIFCLTYDCVREGENKTFNGILCIGKPMRDMNAIIVDDANQPVAKGEKGELCLTGPQLTDGYWKNPEKNAQAFFKSDALGETMTFYRTGDLCFLDEEDDFMFAGRVDHQVKIQGYRVELPEIEFHAREITGLRHVAAVAVPDRIGNLRIYLYLENFHGDHDAVEDGLKEKLPSYMIPSKILTIPEFPLNVNGKIDRKALAKRKV